MYSLRFRRHDGNGEPMTDDPKSSPSAADLRAQGRARRATRFARRERYFNLMASGYSYAQIAKMVRTSVATVRREIDRALAERRLDAPERFAQLQVARLAKPLRLAEAAIELGELKAVATYLRVVAAFDRYHQLAAGTPPPRLSTEAPPLALAAPPKALTFAAPPPGDEPSTVDEMSAPMDSIEQ
jgi:DNA-binding CsgD family transcriptional regulator